MWVVVSAVGYSLFPIFTKHSLDEGLRPVDLLIWRFALAVPLAWVLLLARQQRGGPSSRSAPRLVMFVLGVLFGGLALLAFAGLEHLTAALYTVIINTYPAMVAIGAWLLGRPAPRALWGALVLTMIGISLTVPEVFAGTGGSSALGLWLTLFNAAFYAVYLLVSGSAVSRSVLNGRHFDGIVASTWSLTGSLAFSVVAVAFTGVRVPDTAGAVLGLLGLAVVSTVVAGWALMVGLAELGPAKAAVLATLEPVLTLAWAVVLLGEVLRGVQLLGAAFVLGGVVWAQRLSVQPSVEPRDAAPV